MTPEQLDEWRWERAKRQFPESRHYSLAVDAYRNAVIANVTPDSEPDQDTLDTRAVLGAWYCVPKEHQTSANYNDADEGFEPAKAALAEIKERVRKEAITDSTRDTCEGDGRYRTYRWRGAY